jgi:molecular chaperone Hsp33
MTSATYAFQLEGAPVLGRLVRLDPDVVDKILARHDYPRPAALLLAEALTLAGLCGALAKSARSITLQAEGDGPVPLLVAEWRAGGGLRGYARLSERAATALAGRARMAPFELIGRGVMALTLDQGPDTQQMQGIAPLEGTTLAECAEAYFLQSEQTPTRIRIAAVEDITPAAAVWRAGGALIQRVAGDAARGFTDDDWARAEILFATVEDAELADPALPPDRLLYRLFHEDGVRMAAGEPLLDQCTCDARRVTAVLSRFTVEELQDLTEPDGLIHAKCQFCARTYRLTPQDVAS